MSRSRSLSLAPVLTLTLASFTFAAGPADEPLPKAEAVLAQYIEATGGKAAYEALKNRVSTGTLEVVGAGVKGTMVITQAAPNKSLTLNDIGAVGKTTQGTDGDLAWSVSDLTGDRVLDGVEKETTLRQAKFNGELNWKERYEKAECVGVEDVDGKPAYKVVMTPKTGKPATQYYDKASHLLVKQTLTTESPMGELSVEAYPSDYKKSDGVLMPFTLKQKVLTQEIVITMTEVKHNVDLPADAFAPPDSVKALIKKKGK